VWSSILTSHKPVHDKETIILSCLEPIPITYYLSPHLKKSYRDYPSASAPGPPFLESLVCNITWAIEKDRTPINSIGRVESFVTLTFNLQRPVNDC
jgi:hypothetical protein